MTHFFTTLLFFALATAAHAQTGGPHAGPRPAPATNAPNAMQTVPNAPPALAPEAAKSTASGAYRVPPFETYRPIIDRMPFGKVVAPPAPPPPPQPVDDIRKDQEEQNLARQIRLQAIVRNPDGRTAVGFSDRSMGGEKLVYLAVGDTKDGFHLVDADYHKDTATIEKDGVTITVELGKGLIPTPAAPPPPAANSTPRVGGRTITPSTGRTLRPTEPTHFAPDVPPVPGGPLFDPKTPEQWPLPSGSLLAIDRMLEEGVENTTYRERLEKRRREMVEASARQDADNAAAIDAAADERAAELFLAMWRRANLEAIRNGDDGLGIPLTPEEDAMLTREGVLPANDGEDEE